jgi:hypothetical protein
MLHRKSNWQSNRQTSTNVRRREELSDEERVEGVHGRNERPLFRFLPGLHRYGCTMASCNQAAFDG